MGPEVPPLVLVAGFAAGGGGGMRGVVAISAWSHRLLRRVVSGGCPAPAGCASVAVVGEGVVPVVVLPAAVAGDSPALGGARLVVVAVDTRLW